RVLFRSDRRVPRVPRRDAGEDRAGGGRLARLLLPDRPGAADPAAGPAGRGGADHVRRARPRHQQDEPGRHGGGGAAHHPVGDRRPRRPAPAAALTAAAGDLPAGSAGAADPAARGGNDRGRRRVVPREAFDEPEDGAMLPLLIVLAVLLVPVLEIYVLIQVGQMIGCWPTVGLVAAEALLGAWLVRREGRRAWGALCETVRSGVLRERELGDAVLVMAGGVLLLLPGFLTDVLGAALVLPFTRPLLRRSLSAFA